MREPLRMGFAIAIALVTLAPSGAAQDNFPETPDETLIKAGVLPSEAARWSFRKCAEAVIANALSLTGLAKPKEDGWPLAADEIGETRLKLLLKHQKTIASLRQILELREPLEPPARWNLALAMTSAEAHLRIGSWRWFPDIPDHHWAYESLLMLAQMGLLPRETRLIRGPWPRGRLEFAVATRNAWRSVSEPAMHAKLKSAELSDARDRLARLIRKFTPELRAMHCDPVIMLHACDPRS